MLVMLFNFTEIEDILDFCQDGKYFLKVLKFDGYINFSSMNQSC